MKARIDADTTIDSYPNLYTEGDTSWNILIRQDGSLSLYATWPGGGCHGVVYDTIDVPANERAREVITQLARVAMPVNKLLESLPPEERDVIDRLVTLAEAEEED